MSSRPWYSLSHHWILCSMMTKIMLCSRKTITPQSMSVSSMSWSSRWHSTRVFSDARELTKMKSLCNHLSISFAQTGYFIDKLQISVMLYSSLQHFGIFLFNSKFWLHSWLRGKLFFFISRKDKKLKPLKMRYLQTFIRWEMLYMYIYNFTHKIALFSGS